MNRGLAALATGLAGIMARVVDPRRLLLTVTAGPVAPVTRAAGEVFGGLRMLSQIAEHTGAMVRSTRVLPEMNRTMEGMARDTAALPALADSIGRVAAATEILPEIEARLAAIESAMPVLVEVQQHLTLVPEVLERLDARMDRTANLLERLMVSLDELSGDVQALGAAVGRSGAWPAACRGAGARSSRPRPADRRRAYSTI